MSRISTAATLATRHLRRSRKRLHHAGETNVVKRRKSSIVDRRVVNTTRSYIKTILRVPDLRSWLREPFHLVTKVALWPTDSLRGSLICAPTSQSSLRLAFQPFKGPGSRGRRNSISLSLSLSLHVADPKFKLRVVQ